MITLVLGGARSGKSELAERLAAARPQPVAYLATAVASDPDFEARIARHQARRPASWRTVEAGPDLVAAIVAEPGTLLVDSLGTWVASTADFEPDTERLIKALTGRVGDAIIVSEEVGLGVHPSTDVGGRFRDALGTLNQQVAAVADEVLLVVAGRALRLEGGV